MNGRAFSFQQFLDQTFADEACGPRDEILHVVFSPLNCRSKKLILA
jgi:hypothetical protein